MKIRISDACASQFFHFKPHNEYVITSIVKFGIK